MLLEKEKKAISVVFHESFELGHFAKLLVSVLNFHPPIPFGVIRRVSCVFQFLFSVVLLYCFSSTCFCPRARHFHQ